MLLIALTGPVPAADEAPDFTATTLTGDWGGRRSAAWQEGFQWEAGLKADALRSRGAPRDGTHTISHLDLKLRADLEKLFGWESAVGYVNVIDNRGAGPNARVDSVMGVSNIEVAVPTARLFHTWLQKGFFDDHFSLLAGIYPIDSEFFALESASLLLNPAYGTPADLALTNTPSIFNNAAFGLRAKWYSPERTVYAMGALMDGVPNDPGHPRVSTVHLSRRDGAFAIAELGWIPLETGHALEPTDPAVVRQAPALLAHERYEGLSKYALGLWRYSTRQPDLVDVDAVGDPLQRRSQGGYLLAERTLWGLGDDPLRNVTAFARYTFADRDTIAIDRSWNLGLRVRGPLASRPLDTLVFGWTRGRLAGKYRQLQAGAAAAEESIELTWRFEVAPGVALQPDLQRIRHAGGSAAAHPVTVVGMRLDLVF
ncbi:MAG: carbohydrate porin [Rhodocyclales bacterium]|nr:carbohydrate porin [Rhodocyclales bacterium]